MKKRIIIFLSIILCLATGCSTIDRGVLESANTTEAYYYKTDYIDETFAILNAIEYGDGYKVIFTIDPEIDFGNGIYSPEIQPNSVIETYLTKEEYQNQIDGLAAFESSFSAYTFVIPEGKKATYFHVITEIGTPLDTVLQIARQTKSKGRQQKFNENYISQWKFAWCKL